MSLPVDPDRNPLRRVALAVGGVTAAISGLLGAAVLFGVLTSAQATAIRVVGEQLPTGILAVGALIPLVTGIVSALVGAFGTAKVGERSVTPLSSPRSNAGVPLVEDPAAPRPELGEDFYRGEGI